MGRVPVPHSLHPFVTRELKCLGANVPHALAALEAVGAEADTARTPVDGVSENGPAAVAPQRCLERLRQLRQGGLALKATFVLLRTYNNRAITPLFRGHLMKAQRAIGLLRQELEKFIQLRTHAWPVVTYS